MKQFLAYLNDDSGATAIEYGLIAALVSIAAIVALNQLGDDLQDTFENVSRGLTDGNAQGL